MSLWLLLWRRSIALNEWINDNTLCFAKITEWIEISCVDNYLPFCFSLYTYYIHHHHGFISIGPSWKWICYNNTSNMLSFHFSIKILSASKQHSLFLHYIRNAPPAGGITRLKGVQKMRNARPNLIWTLYSTPPHTMLKIQRPKMWNETMMRPIFRSLLFFLLSASVQRTNPKTCYLRNKQGKLHFAIVP